MRPENWGAVRAIYLEGIASGNSTFEQSAPDWPDWDQGHLKFCRLVARLQSEIVGYRIESGFTQASLCGSHRIQHLCGARGAPARDWVGAFASADRCRRA